MAFPAFALEARARIRLAAFAVLAFVISMGAVPAEAREFATHQVSFGEGPLYSVQELAVARDGLSIVLSDDGQVRRYSLDGHLLDRLYWSPRVPFPGQPLVSICCAESGDIYVGSYFCGTIHKLDQDGAVTKMTGGSGSAFGQFLGLTCMALAPAGTLYVGDFGNDRVQHFSADLDFMNQWALPPAPDEFHPAGPDAMTFDPSGRLWIAWASYSLGGGIHAGRIIAYELNGSEVLEFPVEPDPSDPFQVASNWFFRDIAFDPAGQLWVLLAGNSKESKLRHFDEAGNQVATLPLPEATDRFLFLPDGTIAVTTFGQLTAQHPGGFSWVEHLTASGQYIGDWGDTWWAADRTVNGMLAWSKNAVFDRKGRILIAGGFLKSDASYDLVPAFTFLNRYLPDGNFDVAVFSETDPAETNWHLAVAPDGTVVRSSQPFGIDSYGNRYTLDNSDYLHAKVRKTDASGTLIAEWDLGGRGVVFMCIGMDNFLYVERITGIGIGGYGNCFQVEKYDLDGHLLYCWETFGLGGLLAVDPVGRAYVGDEDISGTVSVRVFSASGSGIDPTTEVPEGKLLAAITSGGPEPFSSVNAVALSPEGRMAVSDWKSSRIHVFQLNPSRFSDISLWFWAMDDIEAAADAGIVQGFSDGTYRPALAVDRAQMAVYISRALAGGDENVPPGPAVPSFSDVPPSHWAYKYVEYAKAHHIVLGRPGGRYRPESLVNRGQMAVFLARALAGADYAIPLPTGAPTFEDVTLRSAWVWCYKHVEYLAAQDIIRGYPDGLYHPERPVARDQMAVFVARAFQLPR